jgi:hypothetical protein
MQRRSARRPLRLAALVLAVLAGPRHAAAQQLGDSDFDPPVPAPAFPEGQGPVVLIDEAHQNFHTSEGRYAPFARLLRRDGYVVQPLREPISAATLGAARILVIANPIAAVNVGNWVLPNPSAFTPTEIDAVSQWVRGGGSLLLIADHMPCPGAADDLADALGLVFYNGFAVRHRDGPDRLITALEDVAGTITFSRADGTLVDHPILAGRATTERVESVMTFTGQAFRPRPDAIDLRPLLIVPDGVVVLLPERAWVFTETTPRVSATGLLQGATLRLGTGRVAAFGEAAMFTAQRSGPQGRPMGMNHPDARGNAQFLLNTVHWLSGLLDEAPATP